MKVQQAFSRNAHAYDEVNIIQKEVLAHLLSKITDTPEKILDIGCGSGGVCRSLDWKVERFVGVDFAKGMLTLHPKAPHITLMEADFNDPALFEALSADTYARIISSSALQWATDMDAVFAHIAALKAPVSLSVFTSATFKTLYEVADLPPLLRSKEEVVALAKTHFDADIETRSYTRSFSSVREMFRYMKRSGVGAGRNLLGYKEMKHIMQAYPLDHLEYEVVFIHENTPRSV
jgi:malonyl-CoA O-methyltransferase